jgi:hypothetical protein
MNGDFYAYTQVVVKKKSGIFLKKRKAVFILFIAAQP